MNPQSISNIQETPQPKCENHSEEYIITIDKVEKSVKNSADIKSNLKKSGSTIAINYAYTLPKGGIAIHTDIKNKNKLTKAIGKTFQTQYNTNLLVSYKSKK